MCLGISRKTWERRIRIGCEDGGRLEVAQDRVQRRALFGIEGVEHSGSAMGELI
jgi:hypothetical protein